jgi:glycoprotease/Kae1 family metallohydrolase
MLVLGIESSAHTFGVGIAKDGKIIANEKSMYDVGTTGMIPKKVAEFHISNSNNIIRKALKTAGLSIRDIEGIGYTKGPGIGNCLQVGQIIAKTLAVRLGIPMADVNHGLGHIEIARLMSRLEDPVVLYVSGGNSQILKATGKKYRHYTILGETFDIGVGNMLDSFARSLKLVPSWGSTVEKTAIGGRYVDMPYTVKGMDFSFTGLLTHSIKQINKHTKQDICYSIQETAFSMLCEATERALLLTNSDEICVCGGVAQNTRLKEMLSKIALSHHSKFGFSENQFNADNGAMIAFVAERMLSNGYKIKIKDCRIEQRYRVDRAVVF